MNKGKEFPDELLTKVDGNKRTFLKKVVIGAAFALPLMLSFSMDGVRLKAAYGQSGGT